MELLLHRPRTEPQLGGLIDQAKSEPLDDWQAANLRETEHEWRQANALPEALVQAQYLARARCEHAWRAQRQANDWPGFLENFREVLRLAREEAHVILRYRIELAPNAREAQAEDLPKLWDEAMMALLGSDTRGNFRDGCLQDVHWSDGTFGYFPCHTLGAMQAAQWFAAIRRAVPDLDARIARADFAPLFDWLCDHIWSQGSRWTTTELAVRASGEPLNTAHFRRHLEARYLG